MKELTKRIRAIVKDEITDRCRVKEVGFHSNIGSVYRIMCNDKFLAEISVCDDWFSISKPNGDICDGPNIEDWEENLRCVLREKEA